MKTVTIADTQEPGFVDAFSNDGRYLFLIRAGKRPLYAAAATIAALLERLSDEPLLTGGWTSFLIRNRPASLQWQCNIMMLADCEALVEQEVFSLLGMTPASWKSLGQAKNAYDLALQALIYHWRPCLNENYPRPRRLPDRYVR